jgi:opacity protein-like surface antigen
MSTFARGQVMHAAEQGGIPIELFAGPSIWKSNWGSVPNFGYMALADIRPALRGKLNGIGVEVEYRDIRFRRSGQPNNFRQRTMGGGPVYSFPFRNRFRFYGKALLEYGTMDFTFKNFPGYTHDSRAVFAPGGGAQYRLTRNIWTRVDYEYQIWQPMFSATKRPTPNGYTFGISYDLRPFGGER